MLGSSAKSDFRREERGVQRRVGLRWLILGFTAFVLVLNYADRSALGVAGPEMMKDLHFSASQFGLVSSIFFVGYAPFCFIGGWLSDRKGPWKVMGAAVGWWSVFTALTAVGGSYIWMLIIRFLFGFGEGPQGALTTKTMRNWFPQRQMGTAVGLTQGCTPLGGAIGTPLVAGLVGATGDWRLPFYILGAVGALAAIGWWVVVRDSPDRHPWAREQDLLEVADDASEQALGEEDLPPVRKLISKPMVIATALAFFGYSWVLYTFLSWFPTYLVDARGVQLKSVAIAGTLPWILGVVGYMLGGVLTDRIAARTGRPAQARKAVIVVGLTGTAVLLALVGAAHSVWPAVALMSGVVFLLYLTGGQYFLMISDTVPGERLGGVVGFVHFIANLSGIVAPLLVGFLVDRTHSWGLVFGICAGICVLSVLVMLVWARRRHMRLV